MSLSLLKALLSDILNIDDDDDDDDCEPFGGWKGR